MSQEQVTPAPRPINAISALTLVLVFPARTFERLKERPHWVVPILFGICCAFVGAVYAVRGGFMHDFIHSMALRTGHEPAAVESGFIGGSILMAVVGVPLIALIEALFFKLAGRLMGGTARFGVVFSAVAYASVAGSIGSLVTAMLMRITGSPTVGTNMAVFLDPGANSILWSLARQMDLFSLWFFVLLGIAAGPVFGLGKRKAAHAGVLFAAIYILVMTIGGVGNAGGIDDPYEDWVETTTASATLHHEPNVDRELLRAAAELSGVAVERATEVVGAKAGDLRGLALDTSVAGESARIGVYVYASLESKKAVTDNGEVAHCVEWANAIHLAVTEGSELAMTREVTKVVAARTLGKMYNPLIREGLALFAGGEWGGLPLSAAAFALLDADELPGLSELADPASYHRLARQRSEPAAGSFFEFVASTRGKESLSGLYAAAVDLRGPADALIERELGASIEALDGQWRDHLRARTAKTE